MAINVRSVYSYFIYWHHMLKESMDEPGMFAIPARGQLNRGKKIPVRVRAREFGLAMRVR